MFYRKFPLDFSEFFYIYFLSKGIKEKKEYQRKVSRKKFTKVYKMGL